MGQRIVLGGGAENKKQADRMLELLFSQIPKTHPVIVVPLAKYSPDYQADVFRRCAGIGRNLGYITFNGLDTELIYAIIHSSSWSVITLGGNQTFLARYARSLREMGVFHNAEVLAGESAGAMFLGEKFRSNRSFDLVENKRVLSGYSIVKDTFIEVHYSSRQRHTSLLSGMNTHNIPFGIGIDCETAVVFDTEKHLDFVKNIPLNAFERESQVEFIEQPKHIRIFGEGNAVFAKMA